MNLKHLLLQFEADGTRHRHLSALHVAISRTICFKLKQRVLQIHVCLAHESRARDFRSPILHYLARINQDFVAQKQYKITDKKI